MGKHSNAFRLIYRNLVPELIQQKVDVLRGESQVFKECFEPTQSIFIHVPKAAGTSIARAIYGQNVGHRKARDYCRVNRKKFSQYFTYGFVRNPWDRAVSAYHFARQGGTEYVQPIDNPIYQSEQFSTFERFVKEWLVDAELNKEDVVFAPQHWWLYEKGTCIVDHVAKLENLNSEIDYIASKIGININIPRLNVSDKSKSYHQYYTSELIELVAEVYKTDIKLFNYHY